MISIVVPCYNEEAVLRSFYTETTGVMSQNGIEYELIFVNDGSRDRTLEISKELAEEDHRVRYLSFSRNFGKESAMLAGLHYSQGDAVILMDADLQHPPSLIPKLIQLHEQGYDQVIAKRNRKGESFTRSLLARVYYRLMNHFVDVTLENGVGDFRLLSRRAVNALLSLNEYNRFSKGLFSWIGFNETYITYDNVTRDIGKSKWSVSNLLNYGIDGVISFNDRPLRMSMYLGFITMGAGILYVLYMLVRIWMLGVDVPGYFTTISAILLIGGVQLFFLGVVGEYIGRIYYEVKRRPHYLIAEQNITQEQPRREYEKTHSL